MKIILRNEQPIYQRPRRLSQLEKTEIDKQTELWLKEGIIVPSNLDFASSMVLVKKRDGSYRICIDYRMLNKEIVKDRYPLPLIEDHLCQLREARIFYTLDLKNGFFHVPVHKDSQKYTAFVTPSAQFEFLRVPFGLCNSPSIFQRFINDVFREHIKDGIIFVYIDDVIIVAENVEEALKRLERVLKTAEAYGLNINWKKCSFLREEIEYLGYRIRYNEIAPSEEKTKAVRNFPRPKSVKKVQSYLGLTGYFRKFIKNYAILAKPLSDLLQKDVEFKFGPRQVAAFEALKTALANSPVLAIYSPTAVTELHCDACLDGYGAVLLQQDPNDGKMHPVHFMSRKTTPAERKYTSYELEVLAVVNSLKKFRVYLLGLHFKIITDCQAFATTLNKKELVPRIARWVLFMEEFDYKIEHRPGKRMKHADALSRSPVMSIQHVVLTHRIRDLQNEDEWIKPIIALLREKDEYEDFLLQDELLYKRHEGRTLLVVPKRMEIEIIKNAHDENGHFALKKTTEIILREFWFRKMSEKTQNYIKNCIRCILINRKSGKQEGFLHPLDKGNTPLDTYHLDHLGPLSPTKKSYQHLFVIVDGFTKYVWLYPVKTLTSKEVIEKLDVQKKNFGNPRRIITDRGTAFTSSIFKEYCEEERIELVQITTGVPRGNGQVERVNRSIIPILSKLSMENDSTWYKYIDRVQAALNSTFHRSLGVTPFEMLFGVRMKKSEDLQLQQLITEDQLAVFQEERDEIRNAARKEIQKMQEENKRGYNKKRKEATQYKINDLVAIKRTQFTQQAKLKPKFIGPYRIIAVKGHERYDVERLEPGEPPMKTSTSADNIKPWYGFDYSVSDCSDSDGDAEDDVTCRKGRVMGPQRECDTTGQQPNAEC